jgi:O-antigen ligase
LIAFYLLVAVMPMIRHPLWSSFVGDLTVIKYVGVLSLAYACLYIGQRYRPPRFIDTIQARWFLAFALFVIGSYLVAGSRHPFELSPLMSFVSFLSFFFITLVVVDSVSRLRITCLVAIASVGYASLHVVREWQKYGNMSAGYRPGWVTGDPNYFSISALLCLPIAFFLLQTKPRPLTRWFCIASMATILFALTLAASRGGFVGLLVGSAIIVLRSPRRLRNASLGILVLAPLMLLAPSTPINRLLHPSRGDQRSTDTRTALWTAGVRMFQAYPLTGIGPGNFKPMVNRFAGDEKVREHIAHNTYIEIAAETGLVGLVCFFGVLVATFISLERTRRQAELAGQHFIVAISKGMSVSLVAFVVSAIFVSATTQKLFWLMVFISMCLPQLIASQPGQVQLAEVVRSPLLVASGRQV